VEATAVGAGAGWRRETTTCVRWLCSSWAWLRQWCGVAINHN